MRKLSLVVATAVLLGTVVSPAFGGPSIRKVARTASKALRSARSAGKTAKTAKRTANTALSFSTAGAAVVQRSSGDVGALPGDFAQFDVPCPAGYRATGFSAGLGALELVAALSYGTGYLGSYYNPSSSTVFTGSLDVNCVRGFSPAAAAAKKPAVRRELRARERQLTAAR